MTKKTSYTQCYLTKYIGANKYKTQTAYIPTKLAKTGNVIKLMRSNGEWEDGWRVEFVYNTVNDVAPAKESDVREHDHAYRAI